MPYECQFLHSKFPLSITTWGNFNNGIYTVIASVRWVGQDTIVVLSWQLLLFSQSRGQQADIICTGHASAEMGLEWPQMLKAGILCNYNDVLYILSKSKVEKTLLFPWCTQSNTHTYYALFLFNWQRSVLNGDSASDEKLVKERSRPTARQRDN